MSQIPDQVRVPAVFQDGRLGPVSAKQYERQVARLQPGEGEAFTVLIMREAEMKRHSQLKHYYGHLLGPYEDYTGDPDGHLMFKAMYLPEGKTSLKELTYDQMADFNRRVEAFIRTRIPEALEAGGAGETAPALAHSA